LKTVAVMVVLPVFISTDNDFTQKKNRENYVQWLWKTAQLQRPIITIQEHFALPG